MQWDLYKSAAVLFMKKEPAIRALGFYTIDCQYTTNVSNDWLYLLLVSTEHDWSKLLSSVSQEMSSSSFTASFESPSLKLAIFHSLKDVIMLM